MARVVFGAADPKGGAAGSQFDLLPRTTSRRLKTCGRFRRATWLICC
jgi:tRNA(Arg) A34 adenosine deaminase TadA